MANRFLDTGFFKSPFVRSLKAPLKTLYCFIICDCDVAGIWAADFEIASVYIGQQVDEVAFKKAFEGKYVDLGGGRYFFPDFIEHQYSKGLSATNPAHSKLILELQKYGLIDENLKLLERPSKGSKVMVKEEEEVMVMEEGVVRKGGLGENQPARFQKPTVEEIATELLTQYPDGNQNGIAQVSQEFFNFYESKGWIVGKAQMKNWKAALHGTWKETLQKKLFPETVAGAKTQNGKQSNFETLQKGLELIYGADT